MGRRPHSFISHEFWESQASTEISILQRPSSTKCQLVNRCISVLFFPHKCFEAEYFWDSLSFDDNILNLKQAFVEGRCSFFSQFLFSPAPHHCVLFGTHSNGICMNVWFIAEIHLHTHTVCNHSSWSKQFFCRNSFSFICCWQYLKNIWKYPLLIIFEKFEFETWLCQQVESSKCLKL